MKTNTSFHKCIIKLCIVFSLLILISSKSYSQDPIIAEVTDSSIVRLPLFKGVDLHIALYNYFCSGTAFGFNGREEGMSYYEMSVNFLFDEKGKLQTAKIARSSGFDYLDRKVLLLSKNFVRKRFMTPAYSKEGPVLCDITIPIVCKYRTLSETDNNQVIRYLSGGNDLYKNGAARYSNKNR